MTDFGDLNIDGVESIELAAARNGDFAPLWAKLRSDRHLNDLERKFIADRLEGKRQGQAARGVKEKVQLLDLFVLDDFLKLTEFFGNNKTDARDIIARQIGEAGKDGRSTGNVEKRIERAKRHSNRLDMTLKERQYRRWRNGTFSPFDLKPGETFEHDGEIFEMPEKPSLYLEKRTPEEIKNLKNPYKKGLQTDYRQ